MSKLIRADTWVCSYIGEDMPFDGLRANSVPPHPSASSGQAFVPPAGVERIHSARIPAFAGMTFGGDVRIS